MFSWVPIDGENGECCPFGSNEYNPSSNGGPGCCRLANDTHDSDCCSLLEDHFEWNPSTRECEDSREPCPCEGCCDFNCCDELEYFMHRAYEESYKHMEGYSTYMTFYEKWYEDFYLWWLSEI